jgi:hypothetical protein
MTELTGQSPLPMGLPRPSYVDSMGSCRIAPSCPPAVPERASGELRGAHARRARVVLSRSLLEAPV